MPDSQIQGFPTVWLYPKGKKTPPYPIDLSKESADVHLFVKVCVDAFLWGRSIRTSMRVNPY